MASKYIENYVSNFQMSSALTAEDIFVEHRSNNTKRDFLFVNRKQAKHIPCKPSDTFAMCKDLADIVSTDLRTDDKVLVIALAETATAIGTLVADYLRQSVYVLHTTRRKDTPGKLILTFKEEHSHAPEHFLFVPENTSLPKFNYILFVDDELTTGKTILNFIDALSPLFPNVHYGIASLCNWQSKESQELYKKRNIRRYYLMSGEIIDAYKKMQDNFQIPASVTETTSYNTVCVKRFSAPLAGRTVYHYPRCALEDILLFVWGLHLPKDRPIRVVGSEEFMYIPLCIARYLESDGYTIRCHSTTRSPIDINEDNSNGIYNGAIFPSIYGNYNTYLYCGPATDELVFMVTDKHIPCEILDMYKNYFQTDIIVLELGRQYLFANDIGGVDEIS